MDVDKVDSEMEIEHDVDEDIIQSLVAVDYSGSTSRKTAYWNYVASVISNLPNNDNMKYILWDTSCELVCYDKMMAQCHSASGHGGTSPDQVAEYIAKNYGKEPINLHLFTDGQVSRQSVLACDRILSENQISFNKVCVHIYDTGGSIDLSVSTPFTRKCTFQIFANGQMVAQGSCREKIDLRQYEDLGYFLSNIDSLKSTIVMQNIGLVNEELRNELLDLKKKLLDSFMKVQVQSNGISYEPLLSALNKREYSVALKEVNSLVIMYQHKLDTPRLIEKAINDMVTACTSPHDFSLDLIKSSRFDRAEVVVDMPAEQVEQVLAQEKSFECPIMLDNDVPALLVIQPDMPILVGVDKDLVEDIINCPLNLWKYKDLVAKVASLLDHPVGCQALKGGLFDVSPLTRRPVLGALTLGAAEDHCKATNWTLAQLFSGGKLIGNPDLWTILVYYIAKNHVKYLSENKTLMNNFECHIKFRLSQHKTNLSLSGLPNYPMIKVPVAAAIWYCVASGDIYAEKNHSQDRLRALVGIGEILMHVLDLLELPYDKEYTINRLKIWRLFGWMMSQKLNKSKLVDLIRSYFQNYIYLEDKDRFIFLDGPQPIARNPKAPILPDFTREFPLEVLVYFAGLVDPSKRIGDIVIKKVISPIPLQFKKNYGYPENWTDNDIYERDAKVPICPLTLRPYFIDQVKRKEWKLCVEETWGCPLDKTISARHYYIRFVIDNLKFPESITEFIEYMYDKQCNRQFDPLDTLPQYTETIVRSLLKQMEEAMKAHHEKLGVVVTPQEFVRIVEQSVNCKQRESIEKDWH